MGILNAALLGVIQGIFMFVPVSSTAHLVVAQHALRRGGADMPPPDSPPMILFDLIVHVGTLVSVAVVFWTPLLVFTRRVLAQAWQWARAPGRTGVAQWSRLGLSLRLFLLGMLSVLVTGVLGLTFRATIAHVFAQPVALTGTLTLTGILLWLSDALPRRRWSLKRLSWPTAVLIGAGQGLALVPGISRSAMTMTFAVLAGMWRRWAAQYSFFLAIPTIVAATLVQVRDVALAGALGAVGWPALLTGFAVAAAVGIVALKLVVWLLYRAQLKIFAIYVWGLAALIPLGVFEGLL